MKFRRSGIVRISSGDDATTAWTTAARGQVGIVKTHTIGSQGVGAGRLDGWVAITAKILLGDIVGDEEDDVRSFGISGECEGQRCEENAESSAAE